MGLHEALMVTEQAMVQKNTESEKLNRQMQSQREELDAEWLRISAVAAALEEAHTYVNQQLKAEEELRKQRQVCQPLPWCQRSPPTPCTSCVYTHGEPNDNSVILREPIRVDPDCEVPILSPSPLTLCQWPENSVQAGVSVGRQLNSFERE